MFTNNNTGIALKYFFTYYFIFEHFKVYHSKCRDLFIQNLKCIMFSGTPCIYLYLYGYTNRFAGIMAAVDQADMYTLTYICGSLPINRPTSHPEYAYSAVYILLWSFEISRNILRNQKILSV